MSSVTTMVAPAIPLWTRPTKTEENLDWADIKIVDLSKFEKPGGKHELAEELRDAV